MPKTFIAKNQGSCITPQTKEVILVWENDSDVYYRFKGDWEVKQTPRERFYEIVQ